MNDAMISAFFPIYLIYFLAYFICQSAKCNGNGVGGGSSSIHLNNKRFSPWFEAIRLHTTRSVCSFVRTFARLQWIIQMPWNALKCHEAQVKQYLGIWGLSSQLRFRLYIGIHYYDYFHIQNCEIKSAKRREQKNGARAKRNHKFA